MRITGLTGFLDVDSVVQQLMQVERRPLVRLQLQRAQLDAERAVWEDLRTRLDSLIAALDRLADPATFRARTASSSNPSAVTATATSDAATGSYTLTVTRLATTHRVASDVFADPSAALGLSGSPVINGKTVAVTPAMNLYQVADAINAAGAGVKAMVVAGQLLLESEATGAAAAISVSDHNNVLARLGIIANHALGATVTASSQDAAHAASAVTDGYTASDQWDAGGGWMDATAGAFPDTVDIDFGTGRTIDQIRIHTLDSAGYPAGQYGVKDVNVYYWDGAAWRPAGSVTGNAAGVITVTLPSAVTTSKIRVEVTASNDGQYARLVEVEAYHTAALFKHPLQAAQDASFTLNGVAVTRSSNVVSDLVAGVTFNLLAASADPVTVTVGLDTSAVRGKVDEFIKDYNDAYRRLNELLAEDGQLQGDGMLLRLQRALRRLATDVVAGAPAGYDRLSLVGVTAQGGVGVKAVDQGLLRLDSSKFDAALAADPAAVERLFAATAAADGYDGVAVRLRAEARRWAEAGGLLETQIEGVSARIDHLDDRLADMEARLAEQEERLYREFARLEQALAVLNNQSAWLAGMAASLESNWAGRR